MEEKHNREVGGSHVCLPVKVEKSVDCLFASQVLSFVHEVKKAMYSKKAVMLDVWDAEKARFRMVPLHVCKQQDKHRRTGLGRDTAGNSGWCTKLGGR